MKMAEFRVKNFKSILDSGNVYLPSSDNINILAGQNESGKTAGLKALYFFEIGSYDGLENDIRVGGYPCVEVTFLLNDDEYSQLSNMMSKKVAEYFKKNGVTWARGDEDTDKHDEILRRFPEDVELNLELSRIYDRKYAVGDESGSSVTMENPNGGNLAQGEDDSGKARKMMEECFGFFEERRPKFVYYSAELENNILPSEVLVGEIEKNQAVLDFQKVFKVDFASMFSSGVSNQRRRLEERRIEASASDQLNHYWRQKICGESSYYNYSVSLHDGEVPGKSRIEFYVAQNDKIPLKMVQKSRGFRWFTGFNLRLRAHEEDLKNKKIILLIDEPGFNLHETGQRDVKAILEEISQESDMQILYSTHLPIMLGGSNIEMSRILLAVKDVNGLTSFKTIGQAIGDVNAKNALLPVCNALGLVSLSGVFDGERCLVVEGIVDYYYLHAGLGGRYRIIPSSGADQVPNLFGILMGFGCMPKILVDGDIKGKAVQKKIGKTYFGGANEEAEKVVKTLEGTNGIEELLTESDVKIVMNDLGVDFDVNKSIIENISHVGKLIFAKRFSELYITKQSDFSRELKEKFVEIKNFYDK